MRLNDFLMELVMALLGAVTIWASKDFPPLARQPHGAGTFPTIVGAFLVGLGLLLSLRGWQQRGALFIRQGQVTLSRTLICLRRWLRVANAAARVPAGRALNAHLVNWLAV